MLMACDGRLDSKAYAAAMKQEGNGARKHRKVSGYQFDVQYETNELLALREGVGPEGLADAVKQRDGMQYYRLTIGTESGEDLVKAGVADLGEVQQIVYYFSFGMKEDVYVEQGGKTIPCAIMHFERSYDLKGGRNFMLGFEDAQTGKGVTTLVIDSKVLNTGPIKFAFNRDELPKLRLEGPAEGSRQ